MTNTKTQPVKFNIHHVTNGTVKARVHYSLDNRYDGRKCVTIYAKDYTDALGAIFRGGEYRNETDTQTDYFDQGHVDLFEGHPLYAAARERAESILAARAAKYATKAAA
jgi:hypothetical protein